MTNRWRKPIEQITGQGVLRIRAAEDHPVSFSYADASGVIKGSLKGEPSIIAEAFKSGRGRLTLETGSHLDLTFVGFSSGSDTVHFETGRGRGF